jgi:2'-hydroxyisoflavone reductase
VHRRRPGHRVGLGKGLKVLVLGGTAFLGRHYVEAALERGHEVTLFNRGQTNPDLFPEAEHLHGDRNQGLSALQGREWDAVFDPSAFVPRHVRTLLATLDGRAGHYTMVSSISVYPLDQADKSETAPVIQLEDPATEAVSENYGGLKALCEQAAEHLLPGRVLNVRAGLVVGPHDPTNRFTYWPQRVARGGEVLAPGRLEAPVQFIHARDIGEWALEMAARGGAGTFNTTGPEPPTTMRRVLETCVAVSRSGATLTWVDEDFLVQKEVGPWMEMPLWIPGHLGDLHNAPIARAVAQGLRFRPLQQTVAETLAWDRARVPGPPQVDAGGRVRERGGMAPERERELLAAWHAGGGGGGKGFARPAGGDVPPPSPGE